MYIYITPGLCFEERLHFAWLSLLSPISQNSAVYTQQQYRSQPLRLICHINACAANVNMEPPSQTTKAMQSTQKIQSQRGSRDSSVGFFVRKTDIYLQQTNKIKSAANNSETLVSFFPSEYENLLQDEGKFGCKQEPLFSRTVVDTSCTIILVKGFLGYFTIKIHHR